MPARSAPVLLLGTQRVNAADPERLLLRLADLWVEATEVGKELRALEEKIAQRMAWVDANRDHPRWGERVAILFGDRKEQERLVRRLREIASEANKLAEQMDDETKRQATTDIHAWASLGSVGIDAVAWDLIPSADWLRDIPPAGDRGAEDGG